MAFKRLTQAQLPKNFYRVGSELPIGEVTLNYHIQSDTVHHQGVAIWKLAYDKDGNNKREFVIAWQGSSQDAPVNFQYSSDSQRFLVDMWYVRNGQTCAEKYAHITPISGEDAVWVKGEDVGVNELDSLLKMSVS